MRCTTLSGGVGVPLHWWWWNGCEVYHFIWWCGCTTPLGGGGGGGMGVKCTTLSGGVGVPTPLGGGGMGVKCTTLSGGVGVPTPLGGGGGMGVRCTTLSGGVCGGMGVRCTTPCGGGMGVRCTTLSGGVGTTPLGGGYRLLHYIYLPVQTPWERMTEVSSLDSMAPVVLTSDGLAVNNRSRPSGNLTLGTIYYSHVIIT